MDSRPSRAVAVWLAAVTFLVFSLVVLGGVTRLTRSGLSIVVWEPVAGAIPPLTDADWNEAFAAYRTSPEGRIVNAAMTVDGFKQIFLVEYLHRLLGRLIGVVFFVPLVWFAVRKQLSARVAKRVGGMLLLGGVQGLFGWLMVKSGLFDAPHVSPHRLALHLGTGVIIFGLLVWMTLDEWNARPAAEKPRGWLWIPAFGVAVLTWVTAVFGAYVAGTRAGFAFNTFPLLNGAWVPEGLWAASPWWTNLFENVLTIQFVHRWLAKLLFVCIAALWVATRIAKTDARSRHAADGLLAAGALQVSLGIGTLLLRVPTWLGATHQGGALIVLTMSLVLTWRLRAAQGAASSAWSRALESATERFRSAA